MQAGILIIGSLFWDAQPRRKTWRKSRLIVQKTIRVAVPIRYGRRSSTRENTFTMTFANGEPDGRGLLVPCRADISDIHAFLTEAEALWKAEDCAASDGSIGKSWGHVGILFRTQTPAAKDLLEAWSDQFQSKCATANHSNGVLSFAWPVTQTPPPGKSHRRRFQHPLAFNHSVIFSDGMRAYQGEERTAGGFLRRAHYERVGTRTIGKFKISGR